jgi:hypothetical protein
MIFMHVMSLTMEACLRRPVKLSILLVSFGHSVAEIETLLHPSSGF